MSIDLAAQIGELYPPDHSRRNAAILALASIVVGVAAFAGVDVYRRPAPRLAPTVAAVVTPRTYVPLVRFARFDASTTFVFPAEHWTAYPVPPPEHRSPAFDRGAAAASLGSVNVRACKRGDGPVGSGHVTVTFTPDGSVVSAVVDSGAFPGTAVGACVAGKFRGARVPPFADAPVRVGKSFRID